MRVGLAHFALGLGLLLACTDPPVVPDADEAPPVPGPSLASFWAELGESEFVLGLARDIPGYGGHHYESPGGSLVISLTEDGSFPEARRTVLTRMAASVAPLPSHVNAAPEPSPSVIERKVEYTFIELARHRARLRALFGFPEVVSLGVDEVHNRVAVGLEDISAKEAVLEKIVELEIPVGVISISERSRVILLGGSGRSPSEPSDSRGEHSLNDTVLDGRLAGGYQVQAEGTAEGDYCTLGVTAVLDNGGVVFFSPSHCSKVPWSYDFGEWGQPDPGNVVAREVWDLPVEDKCGRLFWKYDCRHSDASMMAVIDTFTVALGEIGRTTRRRRDCHLHSLPSCTTVINPRDPTITTLGRKLELTVNEEIDKIGALTGWTFGTVTDTCVDKKNKNDVEFKCSYAAEFVVGNGDSGSPVFEYLDVGRGWAWLGGMIWGGRTWQAGWPLQKRLVFDPGTDRNGLRAGKGSGSRESDGRYQGTERSGELGQHCGVHLAGLPRGTHAV